MLTYISVVDGKPRKLCQQGLCVARAELFDQWWAEYYETQVARKTMMICSSYTVYSLLLTNGRIQAHITKFSEPAERTLIKGDYPKIIPTSDATDAGLLYRQRTKALASVSANDVWPEEDKAHFMQRLAQ